jgi:TIGR03009 family protein
MTWIVRALVALLAGVIATSALAQNAPPPQQQSAPVTAPFPPLTAPQQQQLDQLLLRWEQQGKNIKTLRCDFRRWERDNVFNKVTEGLGELYYAAPDRGTYRVRVGNDEHWTEQWVCDGNSIYEYDAVKKEVIQRILPANLRGKAITDGPLPFLFGTEAEKLKQRYWLRLVQPPPNQPVQLYALEAYPKLQQDAANFSKAELLLQADTLLPYALKLDQPNGKDEVVHTFANIKVDDLLQQLKNVLTAPRTPLGWKHRVEDLSEEAPPPAPTAQRPQPPATRR